MDLDLDLEAFLERLVLPLEDRAEERIALRLHKLRLLNLDGLGVELRCPKRR